jgi:hypothetical protein
LHVRRPPGRTSRCPRPSPHTLHLGHANTADMPALLARDSVAAQQQQEKSPHAASPSAARSRDVSIRTCRSRCLRAPELSRRRSSHNKGGSSGRSVNVLAQPLAVAQRPAQPAAQPVAVEQTGEAEALQRHPVDDADMLKANAGTARNSAAANPVALRLCR